MLYVSTKHLKIDGVMITRTTVTCAHIRKVYEGYGKDAAVYEFAKELGWKIKQVSHATWEVVI